MKIFKILQKTFFIFIILSLLMPAGFISAENDLQILFHDFFQDFINLYPEWGVETGITEDMGYSLRRDTLNDISYDTALREINMYEDYLKKLNAIESKNLSEPEKCDYDVLKWYLEIMIEKKDFLNHDYLVTHMFDIPLWTITNLVEYQNVNTKSDAEAYIKKLSLFDYKINQLLKRVKEQEEANIIPPKKIFERVDKTILNQIPDTLKNCELYKSFERKIKGAKLSDKEKKDYLAEVEKILKDEVYPAMKSYRDYIAELSLKATDDTGVWKLKDGDKYYQWCLKYHTTTDMTADEIHNEGLSEVKRVQSEIMKLYSTLKIDTTKGYQTATEIYWKMMEDSAVSWNMFYEESDEGRKQVISDYNKIVEDVYTELPNVFSTLPKAKVKVEKNPEYKSASAGAYYVAADLAGTRPGVFYINLSWLPDKPGLQTLAYHETVPGHHLQIALQQENKEMHIFRNAVFCTAYIEGWALYAEKLAYEEGWFKDVHTKISYLQSELFRAVRLVLDTGIHAQKWSREDAAFYMQKNLGWVGYGEIDRYTVWPGQACAYKIGELKLVELKNLIKKEQKKNFDIKVFHDKILKGGPMPLNLLEERVKRGL